MLWRVLCMQYFKKWQVHIALFVTVFFALNFLMGFFFQKIEGNAMLTMHDMTYTDNIEICFIGDSLCRRHIGNKQIEKQLDMNSFNLSISNIGIEGSYALMQELFQIHHPKIVVYVYNPIYCYSPEEPIIVQNILWPFLQKIDAKVAYTLNVSRLDGAYMDRFFPWRTFHPETIEDFMLNLSGKIDRENFYNIKIKNIQNKTQNYDKKGFCPYLYVKHNTKALHKIMNQKVVKSQDANMTRQSMVIQKMKRLCDKNKCKLILITSPEMPQILLGDEQYQEAYSEANIICNKYGVPFFNFAYAKEELIPNLTDFFYSPHHFEVTGAELFSEALSKVLKEYLEGQDVSSYFYTHEEYARSKDYILNGWYTETVKNKEITYDADSIHGSTVKPEYQFVAVEKDGKEIILQDYYCTSKCVVREETMKKRTIRIYIRNAANEAQKPVIAIKK